MFIYLLPFLFATIFAALYHLNILRLSKSYYAIALFLLGIFSGFRFEVGPTDWMAYKQFFEQLDLNKNIFVLYNSEDQQFEIGYYGLNYLIKYIGGNYGLVFLLSSLFISCALYKLTNCFSVNKFYILTIYVGYSYILLNFAQIRQSIAISFCILGCNWYLSRRGKFVAFIIASFSILFQFSSLIYLVVFVLAVFSQQITRKKLLLVSLFAGLSLYICSLFINLYSIPKIFAPSAINDKIQIYQDNLSEQGSGQVILSGYFTLLALYLIYNLNLVKSGQKFIALYTIYISFIVLIFALVFPGSYVIFSRILSMAAIFQAISFALLMGHKNNLINSLFFTLTITVAFIYLYRLIYFYEDQFVPYNFNTILFN